MLNEHQNPLHKSKIFELQHLSKLQSLTKISNQELKAKFLFNFQKNLSTQKFFFKNPHAQI